MFQRLFFLLALLIVASQAFLTPSSPVKNGRCVAFTGLAASGDGSDVQGPVDSCRKKIAEALQPMQLIVKSHNDDPNGSHIAVKVVSTMFEGKNRVQRQQMVYKAIWDEMQGPIHAVDELVCKTPAEEGL